MAQLPNAGGAAKQKPKKPPAAAHPSKPPQPPASADTAAENKRDEHEFLIVPKGDISEGVAVPVGVRVRSSWLKKTAKMPSIDGLSVDLAWNGKKIANFTLGKAALRVAVEGGDIQFATRLHILAESTTTKGKLRADLTITSGDQKILKSNEVDLGVSCNDCAAVNKGQLVLSVQPPDKGVVVVRSIAPKPFPESRRLAHVECMFDPPAAGGEPTTEVTKSGALPDHQLIGITVETAELLADEFFLGFNFVPPKTGLLQMAWKYRDASKTETGLQASLYLSQTR